jgi:hypothetical protein
LGGIQIPPQCIGEGWGGVKGLGTRSELINSLGLPASRQSATVAVSTREDRKPLMPRVDELFMSSKNQKILAIVCLIIIIAIGSAIHMKLWHYDTKGEDIYYVWLEGKRILSGENPYARILSGNIRQNNKYATYFPLFYLLSSFTQLMGWREYPDWIYLWRNIFLFFNLGIAGLLFYTFYQSKRFIFAIFSVLFWLFNRWTLHVTAIAHIEFVPIFFLILSLMIFRKHKYASLILFSISLALKQIAVFLVPLYLIWVWQSAENEKAKKSLLALLVLFSIPLLTSLPFILLNVEGFIKSILFSATRSPEGHVNAPSLDARITNSVPAFVGIKAKIPMLFLMSLIYISAVQWKIGMYTSTLITMFIFIDFNSVLFLQYMCWIVPLLPLVICDFLQNNQQRRQANELDSIN